MILGRRKGPWVSGLSGEPFPLMRGSFLLSGGPLASTSQLVTTASLQQAFLHAVSVCFSVPRLSRVRRGTVVSRKKLWPAVWPVELLQAVCCHFSVRAENKLLFTGSLKSIQTVKKCILGSHVSIERRQQLLTATTSQCPLTGKNSSKQAIETTKNKESQHRSSRRWTGFSKHLLLTYIDTAGSQTVARRSTVKSCDRSQAMAPNASSDSERRVSMLPTPREGTVWTQRKCLEDKVHFTVVALTTGKESSRGRGKK